MIVSRFLLLGIVIVACGCATSTPRSASVAVSPDGVDPRLAGVDTLVGGSRVYLEPEVDRPAALPSLGQAPAYPRELKSRRVEGRVEFRFVVDTSGAIEVSTMELISAVHPELAASIREYLVTRRFLPAERAGRRVRMWTVSTFEFRLSPSLS